VGEGADPALAQAELRARRDHARSSLDAAVWSLLLGEPGEGRQTLLDDLARAPDDASGARLRTELRVLVGDWEGAARDAALAVRDGLATYVPGYREYLSAMLSLIEEDEASAEAYAQRLAAIAATRNKLPSGHPTSLAEIPQGLLARDVDRVAAGIEGLLAWHLRRARTRSEVFNSSRAMVCLDAIVAVLLAHHRGLVVPVAAKYRAVDVPFLAIHVTERQGQPLPRALPLGVTTDLIAGKWLQAAGLTLDDPPAPPTAKPSKRARAARTRGPGDVGEDAVRRSLRLKEQARQGSVWQLASWALMLGDPEGARGHLRAGAATARLGWQLTAPRGGGALGWLRKASAMPNHNLVREQFGLALVLGDEDGLRETVSLLRTWMDSVETDLSRRDDPPYHASMRRYAHANGYLDLLCDLIAPDDGHPSAAETAQVGGPLASTRVACQGLVERDPAMLATGLDGMLAEHARSLERRTSPPPPLCEPAIHIAVAARRLGVPVQVDERYADRLVPIEVGNLPEHQDAMGRVACDLLGSVLWSS
jgi:hypothetical protein